MSRTSLDFLWSTTPPWIYIGLGETDRIRWVPSHFYAHDEIRVCVRRLRGWKMRTVDEVMSEIGAALQLFDDFGENWYALEESLCYLDEWLPADAYVIVVEQAEAMLTRDDEQLRALLKTFHAVGQFWSQPVTSPDRFERGPAPFHLLLNVSANQPEKAKAISAAASAEGIQVRTDPPGSQ